ncbi:MAG: TolC family protein [Isosphaeraceae bacterium]|nr:TolC family protein [Isosphaeraceae bacterium]
MKRSIAWKSIVAVAALVGWVRSPRCLGQALETEGPSPTPHASLAAPPSALPTRPVDSLPSTVSPAIERFLKERGEELPPQPPRDVPGAAPGREPVPAAAASPLTTLNLRARQESRDLPSPLPPPAAPPAGAPANGHATAPDFPSLEFGFKIKPAPLEPTDLGFPINLATALRLSDARPLIVAAAQAGVWVAEAQLTRSKVLWVPTFVFGIDYLRHDGGGPDFNKGIMTAPSVNYAEGGAGAMLYVNLTDAIFEPLVQRQTLNSAHFDVQAAKNDAVLQTADAYFHVHQYRGMYAGALYTVERGRDLIERIAQLSRELVPTVEVERARNMLADLEQRAVSARQEWRVASANLTQVLRLDPRAVVVPLEHDHVQITLVDPGRSLDDLMPVALVNRPELSSRQALIQAAEARVRREKMRPVLPLVMLNGFQTPTMYQQFGLFALGPNSSLNQFNGRVDVNIQLMWQLEGFGIGNLARIKNQRGAQSQAIIELRNAQDMVAADVTRALANVQSAAARVLQADRALRTGIITFNGHLEGLGQTRRLENVLVLTFRPQEAVYSLEQLNVSFNEYFTTVTEYNRAQFELFHALGYPASEIARLRLPGAVVPVDTARPAYLPSVGNGPPPATR